MTNEVAFTVDFKEKISATVIETTGVMSSPWRKLVWDNIFAYMKPKIEAVFKEEESKVKQELDEWFLAQMTPDLKSR